MSCPRNMASTTDRTGCEFCPPGTGIDIQGESCESGTGIVSQEQGDAYAREQLAAATNGHGMFITANPHHPPGVACSKGWVADGSGRPCEECQVR
jgi:hypothetical protein